MNSRKTRPVPPLKFTTLKAFNEIHYKDTEWVLEEVLPKGGVSLWAGKPKAGKSTLARSLIVSVSKGLPFLGIPTKKCKVLYLALEEIESELKKHFKQLGASGEEEIGIFCGRAPENTIQQLFEIVESEKPGLIVIDPILRASRVKDSNEYSGVSEIFDEIRELAREAGAHIMCLHHAGKGERTGADSVLGSTAFHGAGDATVVIGRSGSHVKIESFQRQGKGIPPTTLKFDPASRSFSVEGTVEAFEGAKAKEAIMNLLRRSPEPLNRSDIFDGIELRKSDAISGLKSAVDSGQIIRTGKGGKSDPYLYEVAVPTLGKEPQSTIEGSKND